MHPKTRLVAIAIAVLSMACADAPPPTPPPQPNAPSEPIRHSWEVDPKELPTKFSLSLRQEFVESFAQFCTLQVQVSDLYRAVGLECVYSNCVTARTGRELSVEEVYRLFKFARASHLYRGGHSGVDPTPATEGILETLKVRVPTGRAVVLVTSNNATFEESGARRELLKMLRVLQQELSTTLKRLR